MFAPFLGRLTVASLALAAAISASADLAYDLRLNDSSDGTIQYPGEVIALDLFARVVGTAGNSAIEGFQDGYGSIMSSNGGTISGGLSATLAAPFAGPGAQSGRAQDLDGDGDLDLGSNLLVASPDFLFARAASMQTTGGTPLTDGMEFKLATVYFTVGDNVSIINGDTVTISFRVTPFTGRSDITALWMQDGAMMLSSSGGNAPVPTAGSSITLTAIPEPSSLALLGVAALAVAARRRRK